MGSEILDLEPGMDNNQGINKNHGSATLSITKADVKNLILKKITRAMGQTHDHYKYLYCTIHNHMCINSSSECINTSNDYQY
jgi:hypothetical protein